MNNLDGKVAVLTGAARGLGLDYALRLGQLGAKIAICDKSLLSANEYSAEQARLVDGSLEKTLRQVATDVIMAEIDVTDSVATKKYIDQVHRAWGRIDIVIANAGGGGNLGGAKASELEEKPMLEAFSRNFNSAVFTAVAAAPYMKVQRSGKIINIASFMGTMALGAGNAADYAASKAAVAHYTRYLAQDLAPFGVTANAVAPGFIATGQFETRFGKTDPERHREWLSSIPLGRFGKPVDCANVIEFLSTSMSDYITGQVICVDGGLMRGPN